MLNRKKFLISLLFAFGLVGGVAGLSIDSPQVAAKTHYVVRYLNGKYNLFYNVPGRRKSYLLHYGHNYKGQRVYTGGTYWHNHKHYTRVSRNHKFFGFMNIAGANHRKPRIRYRHYAHRHYTRHSREASDKLSYKYNVKLGHTWFRSNDYGEYKLAKKDYNLIKQGLYTYDDKDNKMIPTQKLADQEQQGSKQQQEANQNNQFQTSANNNDTFNQKVPTYIQEMKQQTLQDINQDRESNGLQPVQDSPLMDKIADMRANQANSNFTHYDSSNNNTPYELEDAKKLGISFNMGDYEFTENLVGAGIGHMTMNGDPKAYNNKNGNDMANMDNESMMNYDSDQDNGHRKNILYAPWRYVGIGVSHANDKSFNMAEDFAVSANYGSQGGYNDYNVEN